MSILNKYENCEDICRINEAFEQVLESERPRITIPDRKKRDVLKEGGGTGETEEDKTDLIMKMFNNKKKGYETVLERFDDKTSKYYGFSPAYYVSHKVFVTCKQLVEGQDTRDARGKDMVEVFFPYSSNPGEDDPRYIRWVNKKDLEPMDMSDEWLGKYKKQFFKANHDQIVYKLKRNAEYNNYPDNELNFTALRTMRSPKNIIVKPVIKELTDFSDLWANENNYTYLKEAQLTYCLRQVEIGIKNEHGRPAKDETKDKHQWLMNRLTKITMLSSINPTTKDSIEKILKEDFSDAKTIKGTFYEQFLVPQKNV